MYSHGSTTGWTEGHDVRDTRDGKRGHVEQREWREQSLSGAVIPKSWSRIGERIAPEPSSWIFIATQSVAEDEREREGKSEYSISPAAFFSSLTKWLIKRCNNDVYIASHVAHTFVAGDERNTCHCNTTHSQESQESFEILVCLSSKCYQVLSLPSVHVWRCVVSFLSFSPFILNNCENEPSACLPSPPILV